jgi:hypothetical protein
VPMGNPLLPAHQIHGAYPQQPMHPQPQVGYGMPGLPPASPGMYDPAMTPPLSGSDTSGNEGHYGAHSDHSGAPSPAPSSRRNSLQHRGNLRYNPTPSPSASSGRRSRGQSISDDDGIADITSNRKEATRKQRIEAEQRRRDELRDGYARLKDVLPVSNSKSSKVSLLERGMSARAPTLDPSPSIA